MPTRKAFSMLEVIIAMSMFAMIMVAVLQTLTSVNSFANTEGAVNDINLQAQNALKLVERDLADSSWLIEYAYTNTLTTVSTDRASRYYPYVMVQATTGVPTNATTMNAWSRLPTPALVPSVTPYMTGLPAENLLQSQELVYIKVSRSAPSATPTPTTDRVNYNKNWDGSALPVPGDWRSGVMGMGQFNYGIVLDSVILAYNNSNYVIDTPMVFETYAGSNNLNYNWTTDSQTYPTQNRNCPDGLREYALVVLPDASTHKNMLVRCWRNGKTFAPVYPPAAPTATAGYDIISEYVDRLVIDTYRTLSTLDVNQVRVRLYLSKDTGSANAPKFVSTKVECTVALRSTVDPSYSLNLGTWLGPSGTTHGAMDTEQSGGVQ